MENQSHVDLLKIRDVADGARWQHSDKDKDSGRGVGRLVPLGQRLTGPLHNIVYRNGSAFTLTASTVHENVIPLVANSGHMGMHTIIAHGQ
jgi:hypothetical protein